LVWGAIFGKEEGTAEKEGSQQGRSKPQWGLRKAPLKAKHK